MKIVTYNVNGLRQRIAQFGSLLKFLNSLDADIICFQETKLSRQELTADLVMADGYESFFSCTRTSGHGRIGYSGVATFCRVESAFSSTEVSLPLAAEEGFTGLLENTHSRKNEKPLVTEGLEEFSKEELIKADNEGRCIITDHGHFVLFNVYGPRAESDDAERIQFKLTFFKILERRWESLLRKGRNTLVVGDLNIAPAAIDKCDAAPDFEKNELRRWFRSIMVESGGLFFDVFRAKHPDRREAYTCWPQNTGAEEFNYGSRIDHILCSRSCLHEACDSQCHSFLSCHVKECDILIHFQRWKPGNTARWKGGRRIKLEGSDHVPVYVRLMEIPANPPHSTPPLSARYVPGIHGSQQTIVSVLTKKQLSEEDKIKSMVSSCSDEIMTVEMSGCPFYQFGNSSSPLGGCSSNLESERVISRTSECSKSISSTSKRKKARQSQGSQLSLRSYFQRAVKSSGNELANSNPNASPNRLNVSNLGETSEKISSGNEGRSNSPAPSDLAVDASTSDQSHIDACGSSENEKKNVALTEWRRIQLLMQNSLPLCKGHKEPCVARVVKKAGPTFGRRFYVCARAEGPSSNPEANCGYFKWAASKSRRK